MWKERPFSNGIENVLLSLNLLHTSDIHNVSYAPLSVPFTSKITHIAIGSAVHNMWSLYAASFSSFPDFDSAIIDCALRVCSLKCTAYYAKSHLRRFINSTGELKHVQPHVLQINQESICHSLYSWETSRPSTPQILPCAFHQILSCRKFQPKTCHIIVLYFRLGKISQQYVFVTDF